MTVTGQRVPVSFDRQLERLGAWSGIAWVTLCGGGFFASGLLPVWTPSTDPSELATHLSELKYQIMVGMLMVLAAGVTFLLSWSLTFAYQVRKYANPSPLAFYVLTLVGFLGALIGMMCGVVGSAMAFRVDTLAPETTQLLYDLIWFLFLIPWPPFMLWQLVSGFAILSDTNRQTMFPRWLGYYSIWASAMEMLSALCVFFYNGPFSYNGLVTFWVPGVSFFIWVLVLAIFQIRRLPLATAAPADGSDTDALDAAGEGLGAEIGSIQIPTATVTVN